LQRQSSSRQPRENNHGEARFEGSYLENLISTPPLIPGRRARCRIKGRTSLTENNAIYRDGHAVLVARGVRSFFLPARIFRSIKAAPKPPIQPSGLVPGWDWGGAAQLLQAAGGAQGSDCLKASSARVCFVKLRGHVVISSSFGPFCNFTHR
jgi:hypothetical protein